MKILGRKVLLLLFFLFVFSNFLFLNNSVWGVTEDECRSEQNRDVEAGVSCWERLLTETGQKKATLQSEKARLDATIALALAKINQTVKQIDVLEKEIADLTGKIGRLDISLDSISRVLIKRVSETYKRSKTEPLTLFLSSDSFSKFVTRYKYLQVMQLYDKKLMIQVEGVRTNYENQKNLKEQKQTELEKARLKLESQKVILAQQRADKERLLEITKNDEQRFQNLLAGARAELVAIKGILAGQGREVKVGSMSEGQKIASLIQGSSCNSSGTHLHFMVVKGSETYNPFNYLKDGISFENCSGSSCGGGDGDPFNPTGSWNWPMNSPIHFNQGYGRTWAVQHTWVGRIYDFHNGIDIVSNSTEVKAVKTGVLYQGVYEGNCRLIYVKIDHDDSDFDTYYLHVNY